MKQLCIYFASCLVLLLSLSSCRTGCSLADQQLPEIIIHDTVRLQQLQRDSIFIHDSISTASIGDTIIQYHHHTTYRYKVIYRDSITVRHDTIPYRVTIEKPVRYTPTYMRVLAYIGITFALAFIIIVIIKLRF